jgi:hypothetical protein
MFGKVLRYHAPASAPATRIGPTGARWAVSTPVPTVRALSWVSASRRVLLVLSLSETGLGDPCSHYERHPRCPWVQHPTMRPQEDQEGTARGQVATRGSREASTLAPFLRNFFYCVRNMPERGLMLRPSCLARQCSCRARCAPKESVCLKSCAPSGSRAPGRRRQGAACHISNGKRPPATGPSAPRRVPASACVGTAARPNAWCANYAKRGGLCRGPNHTTHGPGCGVRGQAGCGEARWGADGTPAQGSHGALQRAVRLWTAPLHGRSVCSARAS